VVVQHQPKPAISLGSHPVEKAPDPNQGRSAERTLSRSVPLCPCRRALGSRKARERSVPARYQVVGSFSQKRDARHTNASTACATSPRLRQPYPHERERKLPRFPQSRAITVAPKPTAVRETTLRTAKQRTLTSTSASQASHGGGSHPLRLAGMLSGPLSSRIFSRFRGPLTVRLLPSTTASAGASLCHDDFLHRDHSGELHRPSRERAAHSMR
jgi:hypothetical protein